MENDKQNKIIAASIGATVNSIIMTPFDVVKTRLQTQLPPEPLFHPTSMLTNSPSSYASSSSNPYSASRLLQSSSCCQTSYFSANVQNNSILCKFDPTFRSRPPSPSIKHLKHFSSAVPKTNSAVIISDSCLFPNPRIATEVLTRDIPPDRRHFTGIFDAISGIVKQEGPTALWKGAGTAVVMSVPAQVGYMMGYDWLRRTLLNADNLPTFVTYNSGEERCTTTWYQASALIFSGGLARSVVATVFSPLELLRTRIQYLPASESSIRLILRDLMKSPSSPSPSISFLWRGLPATLWRDVPFSAIYWTGYEGLKKFTTGKGMGEGWSGRNELKKYSLNWWWDRFGAATFSGALAAMFAATLTHPFDVVKTRRQASDHLVDSPSLSSKSTMDIIRDIHQREGIAGLMKGLSPRLAKIGPACAIMIGAYEGVGGLLGEK